MVKKGKSNPVDLGQKEKNTHDHSKHAVEVFRSSIWAGSKKGSRIGRGKNLGPTPETA